MAALVRPRIEMFSSANKGLLSYLNEAVKDVKSDVDSINSKLDAIISSSNETNVRMAELNAKIDILSDARNRMSDDIKKLSENANGFSKQLISFIKPALMVVFGAGFIISMFMHDPNVSEAVSKVESLEKPSITL